MVLGKSPGEGIQIVIRDDHERRELGARQVQPDARRGFEIETPSDRVGLTKKEAVRSGDRPGDRLAGRDRTRRGGGAEGRPEGQR
jgi:hypothetical protein